MSTFDHVPYASGEPTRDPTYPIPPPGEYYATVRWVKELVNSTISSVDPDNVHKILNNLIATWDPSNAMQKIPGAFENAIPKFDHSGQVIPSDLSLTELTRLRDEAQSAVQSIESKVDKVEGKGLSTCDFTEDLRQKLEGLDPNALTLDKSLSKDGYAADALAVGQVTRQNREYIEALQALLKAEDGSYINVGSSITELTQNFNSITELTQNFNSSITELTQNFEDLRSVVGSISSNDVEEVKSKLEFITAELADTDTIKSLHDSLHEELIEFGKALSSKVTNEDVVAILDEYMENNESDSASVADRVAALESGKVDKTDFGELQAQVEGKASKGQVTSLDTRVGSLERAVGEKVNTSDYDSYKRGIAGKLEAIEDRISELVDAGITQKRGLSDLVIYAEEDDVLVATTDKLAAQSDLEQRRKIDDLEVVIGVERDEAGNVVKVVTTSLVTEASLETYLNNKYDIAERTYYG